MEPDTAPKTEGVREQSVLVDGQSARVFRGGRGERLLLIHGGWGGASMHWSPVWERLAARFEVIAPDLPGIGRTDQRPLGSLGAYARWLSALLDALDVPDAWCVGNSFGASVACDLAERSPARCRGLVLVNGIAMPPTPPWLRRLGERPFGQRVLRVIERRVAYTPAALRRAFFDASKVPDALRSLVRQPAPPQVSAFAEILAQGGSPVSHAHAPLLLWGEDDHLPGTSAAAARRLQASWPGATLTFVKSAGHMPQVENPTAFVDALVSFVERASQPVR